MPRKSATALTNDERDSLLAAVMRMKATIANPGAPSKQQISIYDQFAALHLGCLDVTVPDGSTSNMGHRGPAFLPWHREFLLSFEKALVSLGSTTGLPYWDWTDHAGTANKLFVNEFLGPRGGLIRVAYFAFDAPGTKQNNFAKPGWWPKNLPGWRVRTSLAYDRGTTLQRRLNPRSLAIPEDVRRTLSRPAYEDSATSIETDPIGGNLTPQPKGFRNRLESGLRMHNYGHGWDWSVDIWAIHILHPTTSFSSCTTVTSTDCGQSGKTMAIRVARFTPGRSQEKMRVTS